MKNLNRITLLFLLIVFSCSKENIEINGEEQKNLNSNFNNELICDDSQDFNNHNKNQSQLNYNNNQSPYNSKESYLLSLPPGTKIQATTNSGNIIKVPLYQTSFYHKKMLEFEISGFQDLNWPAKKWSIIEKKNIREYFKLIKKNWLTPEFYSYVKSLVDNNKSNAFFNKVKTVKRNVLIKYYNGRFSAASNRYSYIAYHWEFNIEDLNFLKESLSHELVHHLGFGHNGIPYGTQAKVKDMINQGKGNYTIYNININQISAYCAPNGSTYNNFNDYIHYLEIPDTGIKINNWEWNDNDYVLKFTPIRFRRGEKYQSITQLLKSGKYSVWIDFNRNFKFDSYEKIISDAHVKNSYEVSIQNFWFPTYVNSGVYRLRVVKDNYYSPQACYFYKGQTIDFNNVTID